MALITHDELLRLHAAVISSRAVGARDALLAGVDRHFVAGLPSAASPSDQLLQDLNALNIASTLADDTVPLLLWLRNAATLTHGRRESAVFAQALDRIAQALAPSASPARSTDEQDPSPLLDLLHEVYNEGNLIIFAGAGVSSAGGLPNESQLVTQILDHLVATSADNALISEAQELAARGQYLDAMFAAQSALGPVAFAEIVQRAVDDRERSIPEAARLIAMLAPRLRGVITTNMDRFLERAFGGAWPTFTQVPSDLAQQRQYILHLYGTLTDRSTWIYSRDYYDHAPFGSSQLQTAFAALFRAFTILFVGCSVADGAFQQLLTSLRNLGGDQPPRHFILAPQGTRPFLRDRLQRLGLQIITHGGAPGDDVDVLRALVRRETPPIPKVPLLRAPQSRTQADHTEPASREASVAGAPPSVAVGAAPVQIQDIFRTTGEPGVTFVVPSQLAELAVFVRTLGQGLVVEGPSGIGKTTATKRAFAFVNSPFPARWFSGLDAADLDDLDRVLVSSFTGYLVIDDFHHLSEQRKRTVARLIKVLADSNRQDAKIVVIGINPVGHSLVHEFPDLAGRFETITLGKQSRELVSELIEKGERAANIRFSKRAEFIEHANGSLFTAQQLCFRAAIKANVFTTQPFPQRVSVGPREVLDAVMNTLRFKYYDRLRSFAACDAAVSPRGACLALLWILSQEPSGYVSLDDVSDRYSHLSVATRWLRDGNLAALFDRVPRLEYLLHFDTMAGVVSMDDPQLAYYLAKLDWLDFARRTGHRAVRMGHDGLEFDLVGDPGSPAAQTQSSHVASPILASSDTSSKAVSMSTTIVHLSDLHFSSKDNAARQFVQLAEDLQRELGAPRVDVLLLSGDVSNMALAEEFAVAESFIQQLSGELKLSPEQVVMVPGNHDLSWKKSKQSYFFCRREEYSGALEEGHFIDRGDGILEVRDEGQYAERFDEFSRFYLSVKGEKYSPRYDEQGTIHSYADKKLLILGLNSSWQIDHHYRSRAGIHPDALASALTRIRQNRTYDDYRKIAVWHHPISSSGQDRIVDTGCMEQLAKAGFRFLLHGHIHKADGGLYRYDMSSGGRRLDVIGAGTFGAPTKEWYPGYPLQYNLLRIGDDAVVVETRRREEVNGAWKPDARWLRGSSDPSPRYEILL